MDLPSLPPPLPAPKKNRTWIIIAVVAAVCALVMMVAVVAGITAFKRVRERAVASREARAQIEQATDAEREKMAEMIENGATSGGDAALGRVKEQLEKSAANLSGGDAKAVRAMANVTGKMQAQMREYETALGRLTNEEVFSFKIRERATFAVHRQLIGDFLAKNQQLTDSLRNGGDMVRTELDQAGVNAKMRDATVAGFLNSQVRMRPLQTRIRGADQTLGDSALAILDLLEKKWGKWKLDAATGAPIFQDDKTLESYNALIEKIQAAAADQTEAQGELVRLMRAK